jgi:DNA primase
MLQKLADPLERDLYLRELARMLAVDVRSLGAGRGDTPPDPGQAKARSAATVGESVVALLCRYPEIAAEFRSSGLTGLLSSELARIAEMLLDRAARGETADFSWLLDPQSGIQLDESLAALVMDDAHLVDLDPFKALDDLRRTLERQALKNMDAKSLRRELLQLDSDSPRYWELMETLNDLRNRKSQLS